MAIFKCKICGGSLEIDSTQSVATCEYCGTKQTLPKLDNERRANLYDRANHFRRNNDFDKAMGIYENILNEDNTDAEAYWSIVLCRYGIEYVEDPATHKRVPTVNRAQFTSIFDDEDYKSAIANADGYQREIFEAEATAINEIQKGILAISQKEEPFDVFVCYKETDTSGRRTQDSVLATELYHELTREGFKVFFSRITLEDKLGVAYEPYIFAALHSAKVMVILGTRPEHFNAVWVKNEWSRFLALIKNGAKKTLIPAYRDMDPYDLPEEFSHLQAQDMSKLGFMQDLTRGIKKIVEADAPKATVKETIVATAAAINVTPLLKRAFMFLEDGDFDRADEFCEQVLNQDPENAQAYLGKLMAELRVKRQSELANCVESFENNKNYEKVIRFADTKLSSELRGYVATIKDRNAKKAEEARKEALYLKAMDDYKSYDISRLQTAINVFNSLRDYKDSDERIRLCQAKIDQIRIKEENDRVERERLAEQKRLEDARNAEIAQAEKIRKAQRNKIIGIGLIVSIAILIACVIISVVIYTNTESYIYETKDNSTGITINNFRDACPNNLIIPDHINGKPVTEIGDNAFEERHIGRTISAKSISIPSTVTKIGHSAFRGCKNLETINIPATCTEIESWALLDCDNLRSINFGGTLEEWENITFGQDWAPTSNYEVFVVYKDEVLPIIEVKYLMAIELYSSKKYEEAYLAFKALDYKDSYEQAEKILYEHPSVAQIKDYIKLGSYEQDNNILNGKEEIEWLVLAKEKDRMLVVSKYALDAQPFNTVSTFTNWENCSLRTWLNFTFLNDAFTSEMQSMIETTEIIWSQYAYENPTQDKVFLLSNTEVKIYFSSQSARKCQATAYAEANCNAYAINSNGYCDWWLRSRGGYANEAARMFSDGSGVDSETGDDVITKNAVRPAMWIDISSME
ncbi:MAG: TIR domain-containing protein [Ruminococcaceae bacterium]|nr:TIR domain-containing protein [Oscillospiraceae bacterium]